MTGEAILSNAVKNGPMISIIVAVMNGEANLQACIDSVATQSYPICELIIIDGGSNDGTVNILKKNDAKVAHWISEPDRGIYDAWNKGLAQAKGDWMCFLGADDCLWDSQVLEGIAPHLVKAYPDSRIVYGTLAVIDESGSVVCMIDQPWESAKSRFFFAMSIPHPGMLHHRSLFDSHGQFDESFQIAGDYELLLRELRSTAPYYAPGFIQARWREGGVTTRLSTVLKLIAERRRALSKHGFQHSRPLILWMYFEDVGRVLIRAVLGEWAMRGVQKWYRQVLQGWRLRSC